MIFDILESSKKEDNFFEVDLHIFKQLEYISLKNEDKSFILFSDVDKYFNNLSFSTSIFS